MDRWREILDRVNAALEVGRQYRQAAGEVRAAALRLSENHVRDATARGDSAPRLAREEAARLHQFHVLSPEAAEAHITEMRERALAEIASHVEMAEHHRDQAIDEAARQLVKLAPDGTEAVAARVEMADAAHRVRSLLDAGTDPGDIAARAATLGDRTTLTALRREVEYLMPAAGQRLDDTIAERLGLGPGDHDGDVVRGVVRRIEDLELSLMNGRERDARELQLRVAREWPSIEAKLQQATQKIDSGPSLEDAVSARYAALSAPEPVAADA